MEAKANVPDSEEVASGFIQPLFSNICFSSFLYRRRNISAKVATRRKEILTSSHVDSVWLQVDNIWPGSQTISDVFVDNEVFIKGKRVLEFGAGCALPSLVCILLGASVVTITDFPAYGVLENIEALIDSNNLRSQDCLISVQAYKWGAPVDTLLTPTFQSGEINEYSLYQVIILAELLWKDTFKYHHDLLQSCKDCLAQDGTVYVSFCHRECESHRREDDMDFFTHAQRVFGFKYELYGTYPNKNYGFDESDVDVMVYKMFM